MSFGQILRAAREAKGLTTSELAARTHLLVQIVEGLENEDFRRIPAPIYGRGFVKLYCETVGLDPKPLQAEFMSLYGRKDTPPKAPPPPPPPPPPKVTLPEPPASLEPPAPELPINTDQPVSELPAAAELPAQEPPVVQEPPTPEPPLADDATEVASPEPPPRRDYGELFEQAYATDEPEKPTAAEKFRDTMSNVSHGVFANVKKLPPNTGRIIMVAVCSLILLALIVWGVSALYRATTPQPSTTDTPQAPVVTPTKPDAPPAKAPLPTKQATARGEGKPADVRPGALKASGIDIPSLYID